MIDILLYERALKQTYISVNDSKRFDATQLQQLIVSDSINGSTPKSLFNVNESIIERVRLAGNVISNEDFNKILPTDRQALISKGIYPTKDTPTALDNMPFITREQFESMTPGDRQLTMANKIDIKEVSENRELNIPSLISALQRQDIPEDVKED